MIGRATVVHIITKLELGGAQENTLYTCRRLDRARYRVLLWHGPDGFLDDDAASIEDAEVSVIGDLVRQVAPARDAACVRELSSRLAALKPGPVIVHTHSSKAGILGRLAAQLAGVGPVVHSIHGFGFHDGQPALKNAVFINAERAASRATDAFIAVSRANVAEARAREIIRPGQLVEVIRSGFDIDAFASRAADGPALRGTLELPEDAELILCIANMKPQKDPLTMVAAMAALKERRPRAVLLYAGDGGLRPQVEAAINAAGLGDQFRLIGWRRDVPELMGAADIIALSSIFEGLLRVAVQALVARKPFVGTRVDGTPEIIRDGQNGFLVEPRDPVALANALEAALQHRPVDPTDVSRVRAWDADEMVRAQERLYERLIAA